MRQEEFEKLITDTTKQISGDIFWIADEDHSPAVEFRFDLPLFKDLCPGYG